MKILIVSPNFPPINTPDLHRVRMMLPFLVKQGVKVLILAVEPKYVEAPKDKYLANTIPEEVQVIRVKAMNYKWTRKLGLGNLGIRSFFYLWKKGNEIIKKYQPDIIFFSTTVFLVMPLGRIWKNKFRIPFILDFQDPWRNDYYKTLPKAQRPKKYWFIHFLNSFYEKWTVPYADGIIAVNERYINILRKRYSDKITAETIVLPLGAPSSDFVFVKNTNIASPISLDTNFINLVYTGVIPENMKFSVEAIIKAVKKYNANSNKKIKLYFVGTNYAPEFLHRPVLKDLVEKYSMEDYVFEQTKRIAYFEAIKLMLEADLLLLPGTTDKNYTASKFFLYILANKPILIVFHKDSPLYSIVKQISNLPYIPIGGNEALEEVATMALENLNLLLSNFPLKIDYKKFEKYTDKQMTETFLNFINKIV